MTADWPGKIATLKEDVMEDVTADKDGGLVKLEMCVPGSNVRLSPA